ncbi:hypothetical protein [Candidatus Methylomirabilis sp.]|uniref:hypothetical protein n=1 Tax=Candidatus Methylomirabilis sp. TaxID=2032687 RepID=UPI00307660EC
MMVICAYIPGEAPVALWKLSSRERYRRILRQVGVTAMAEELAAVPPGDSVLIVHGEYLVDSRLLHDLAQSGNVLIEVPVGPARRVMAAHVPADAALATCAILSWEASPATAQRNPNLILLTGSLALGWPDLALMAVTVWTAVSTALLLGRLSLVVYTRLAYGSLRSLLAEGAGPGGPLTGRPAVDRCALIFGGRRVIEMASA